jgi:hypothetical protein
MKQALIYSLKVWLTTVVLGLRISGLIRICMDTDHLIYKWSDMFSSAMYDIPVGLIACLPSWALFILSVWALKKSKSSLILVKLFLSLIGVMLSILPFAIVFNHQLFNINYLPDMLPDLFGYTLITVAGVWFYKLILDDKAPTITPNLS